VLSLKEKKILWVFPNNKYPTKDEIPENELRLRLKSIVFDAKAPQINDIMLLGLIDSCELTKEVFWEKNYKQATIQIKNIISAENLPDYFNDSIKEISDQITVALMAVMVSTVFISTGS